jgi:hypothetical protein
VKQIPQQHGSTQLTWVLSKVKVALQNYVQDAHVSGEFPPFTCEEMESTTISKVKINPTLIEAYHYSSGACFFTSWGCRFFGLLLPHAVPVAA